MFEIDNDEPPSNFKPRKGRESKYPFDKLEVGQSFHVPSEGYGNPELWMQAPVNAAKRKYRTAILDSDTQVAEAICVTEYQKNGNKRARDVDGNFIVLGVRSFTQDRDFRIEPVDEHDPRGVGARIRRIK